MKILSRKPLLFAIAAAGLATVAGVVALAPSGCASDCGSNCPINTALIETPTNTDPGITDLAFEGPACPTGRPGCRGDDQTTQCNHIYVTGTAEGYCDLYIALVYREPMVIRLQFGPATTVGCCRGYPVVGDWHFTIPIAFDAGIYGGDGNTGQVRVLTDGGDDASADAGDTTDAPPDGAVDAGTAD
jgi:hypothetical protein